MAGLTPFDHLDELIHPHILDYVGTAAEPPHFNSLDTIAAPKA